MVAKAKTADVDVQSIEDEINTYKQVLKQTDYQALKYAEGKISEEDYAPIMAMRQEMRDKINALEESL